MVVQSRYRPALSFLLFIIGLVFWAAPLHSAQSSEKRLQEPTKQAIEVDVELLDVASNTVSANTDSKTIAATQKEQKKTATLSNNIADLSSLPTIEANAYVLMDATSGYIIAAKNEDLKVAPASLTKMMTSYIISKKISNGELQLNDSVGISRNADAKRFPGGSRMWLEAGTRVQLDDLHRGLVVVSANDAAVALAEHSENSVNKFVKLMNATALELGLENTQFKNPHGLPTEGHYSTARDMALLSKAIIWDYPKDYFIYREKNFSYNGVTQSNRNTLLWQNDYVDGIKTGFTNDAGYCLAASAIKDGLRLIAVVLGTENESARAWEAQKLLSYGFSNFDSHLIYKAHSEVKQYRVWQGNAKTVSLGVLEDIYLTVPKGRQNELETNLILEEKLRAPLVKDEKVGTIEVKWQGKVLLSKPLLVMEDVAEGGYFRRIWDSWVLFFYDILS